jgi:hypothetical protein
MISRSRTTLVHTLTLCALVLGAVLPANSASAEWIYSYVPVSAGGSSRTTMGFVSGTLSPASFYLTLHYTDASGNTGTRFQTVTVPPRGTVQYADSYTELFGLPEGRWGTIDVVSTTNGTYWADLQTTAGPTWLPIITMDSPSNMALGSAEVFGTLIEKSADWRTNLILVETANDWATVERTLHGPRGRAAAGTFNVAPRQYLQINDMFGPNGFGMKPRMEFIGWTVSARVVSGAGRVIATTTKITWVTGAAVIASLNECGLQVCGGGGCIICFQPSKP